MTIESVSANALCVALIAGAVPVAPAVGAEGMASSDRYAGAAAALQHFPLREPDAMNIMLRADRDKDGVLSLEELEQYDLTIAHRFREADRDRDGKLTYDELERLLSAPERSAASQR
jgi:hypothetical protein